MELINKIIDTLHNDETIIVITENEPLKNQVLDKYGDDKRVRHKELRRRKLFTSI